MNDFDHAGAFVVQFRTATDFTCGRVEHIASGRTAHFESTKQLLEAFARLSKPAPADHQTPSRRGL
jgi:hypothetical protein